MQSGELDLALLTPKDAERFAEKDYAMQYVFGKEGEGLWEIAKRNRVKEEQILAQNQDVVFPLIQDTGFVLFFQKLI